jgi:hypothetical protein
MSSSSSQLHDSRTILDQDYRLPRHGLRERTTGGAMFKDPGTYTSRFNQVVKMAARSPGPGAYTLPSLPPVAGRGRTFCKAPLKGPANTKT